MSFFGKIKNALERSPVHVIVLPFFFLLSIYIQFAGLLDPAALTRAILFIAGGLFILFMIFYLLFRNKVNAGIATTIAGILYLFFGNIKEGLSKLPLLEYISHYRTLLPVLLVIAVYLVSRLYKSKPLLQLNLFLNLLLLISVVIEVGRLIALTRHPDEEPVRAGRTNDGPALAGRLPDIYYIVPDCYPSSSYQRDVLGVNANELDSLLAAKGFYVVKEPRSNYKYTAFSMASVFNMDYLEWLKEVSYLRPYHYNRATAMVEKAAVFQWMENHQYRMYNLSVFDIPGHASVKKERFLSATGAAIIFYNTFYNCLRRDVIPDLFPGLRKDLVDQQHQNNKVLLEGFRAYNRQVLDSLVSISAERNPALPRFVYAHLEMPHFPYFFDSTGNPYPDAEVFGSQMITHKERFMNYIGYTNKKISSLLDTMISASGREAIFIIQSDHGLNDIAGSRKEDAFRNYTAFYFPDREYSSIPDSMTNVNTFRIILNKYFGQRLPLLPDSTIYNK